MYSHDSITTSFTYRWLPFTTPRSMCLSLNDGACHTPHPPLGGYSLHMAAWRLALPAMGFQMPSGFAPFIIYLLCGMLRPAPGVCRDWGLEDGINEEALTPFVYLLLSLSPSLHLAWVCLGVCVCELLMKSQRHSSANKHVN